MQNTANSTISSCSVEPVTLLRNTEILLKCVGRYLIGEFLVPHRLLSTSMHEGGMREDCRFVVNHQSCEPSGDNAAMERFRSLGGEGYHRFACEQAGLPPESTALCGTAANMHCASLVERTHRELTVTAITTAGVEGNATRSGDPSSWHELAAGCEREAPHHGTIVNLVFINQPCTRGCLAKAASMLTEGKTAALLDLRVPSRQSSALATGTGTDQFVIASPLVEGSNWERNYSGAHNTLGQLIGEAVRDSTTEALRHQNGLISSLRASVFSALGRYGLTRDVQETVSRTVLGDKLADFMMRNIETITRDPPTAALAYSIAELIDIARCGIVTQASSAQLLGQQCALLASLVAVDPAGVHRFCQRLSTTPDLPPAELVARAIAIGFEAKWMREPEGQVGC
jgi:adenosylcobinamide amidohydrolase